MFFGKKLRELRLKHAKMGLRNFSKKIGMKGSDYSRIERGHIAPPDDAEWFWKVIYALNLGGDMMAQLELTNLMREPFVMQKMDENILPSPLTHTPDGKILSRDKLRALAEDIQQRARDHNKKADEHNSKMKKE